LQSILRPAYTRNWIDDRAVKPIGVDIQTARETLPRCRPHFERPPVFAIQIEVDPRGHVVRCEPAMVAVLQEHRSNDLGIFASGSTHADKPCVVN